MTQDPHGGTNACFHSSGHLCFPGRERPSLIFSEPWRPLRLRSGHALRCLRDKALFRVGFCRARHPRIAKAPPSPPFFTIVCLVRFGVVVARHFTSNAYASNCPFDRTRLKWPQAYQYRARADSSPAMGERIRVRSCENVLERNLGLERLALMFWERSVGSLLYRWNEN
jgi:hypothetical protein